MKFNLRNLAIIATLIIGLNQVADGHIDATSKRIIDDWVSSREIPKFNEIKEMTHVEWQMLIDNRCIPPLTKFSFENKTYHEIAKAYFNQYFSLIFSSHFFSFITWTLIEGNTFAGWVNPMPKAFKDALRLHYHFNRLAHGEDKWLDDFKIDIPVSCLVEYGIIPTPCQMKLQELINLEANGSIEREAEIYAQHLADLGQLNTIGRLKVLVKKLIQGLNGENSFGLSELKEIEIILKNLPESFKIMVIKKYAQLTELEGKLFAQDKTFKESSSLNTLIGNAECKAKFLYAIERSHKLDLTNKYITNLTREDLALLGQDTLNNIKELILSGNSFTALPGDVFADLINLETIVISNNDELKVLPSALFRGNPKLRQVIISNNPYLKIDQTIFSGISPDAVLELLDLSKNNLRDGDLPYLASMPVEKINLANNGLTTLPADIYLQSGWQSVKSLNLSGNKIVSLNSIADRSMQNLVKLNLSDNKGIDVTNVSLNGQPSIYWPKIEILDLEHCGITKIDSTSFASFLTLKTLYLSKNGLQELAEECVEPGFNRNINLEDLYLDDNQLTSITPVTFCNQQHLKCLDLEHNKIKVITANMFGNLPHLTELNLQGNSISKIEPQGLPRCEVYLAGNHLYDIDLMRDDFRKALERGKNALHRLVECFRPKNNIVAKPEPKVEEVIIETTIQIPTQQEVKVAQSTEQSMVSQHNESRYADLFVDYSSQDDTPRTAQPLYPDLTESNQFNQPTPSAPSAPVEYVS